MKNGRLPNDFMRNLSSHHKVVEKVADDHQVQVLQPKEPNVSKDESCKHEAKYKATAHVDPLEDYQTHMLLPLLSVRTKKV